jgi:hypothetical protein
MSNPKQGSAVTSINIPIRPIKNQKYPQPTKNHQQTSKEPNHLALTINQKEFTRITYKGC